MGSHMRPVYSCLPCQRPSRHDFMTSRSVLPSLRDNSKKNMNDNAPSKTSHRVFFQSKVATATLQLKHGRLWLAMPWFHQKASWLKPKLCCCLHRIPSWQESRVKSCVDGLTIGPCHVHISRTRTSIR